MADPETPEQQPTPEQTPEQTPGGEEQPQQRFLDEDGDGPAEEVEHPTKLLRIAHSTRSMLDEVKTTELDEAGRKRLADIHNRTIESLKEILSEDLSEELTEDVQGLHEGDTPTGAELRVAQAQLAGWLEGLFRGIQASMATQQMAAQKQLQQMKQQKAIEGGQGQGTGQYL